MARFARFRRRNGIACAGDVNPTVSHAFLDILEQSGSATARAGWAPQHLALAAPGGRLVGVVPMYLKSHSYGEYVFDWGWADAYERAGGRYYPKLLCAVPFTPVPGPRLLVAPDAPAETRLHLVAGMVELARQRKLSSLHVNFPEARDFEAFEQAGFLPRIGQQFHWANDGYRDFDDYLAALNSRKRKAVKKERREALAGGIEIDMLTGSDLTERAWDAFYRLYLGTSDRKWGSAYLTRRFFSMLGERMPDKVVLFMARRGERLHRRRVQHPRARHDLRPQLGRAPRIPLPAFRMLLLPGDRVRDQPRAEAGRGRRPGPAQIAARLSAGADLQRALDPRSRLPPRRRRVSRPRARDGRAQDRAARRILAVPPRGPGTAGIEDRRP